MSDSDARTEDLVRRLVMLAKKLGRGCSCDYDYRCGNCQLIIDVVDLALEIDP